MAAGGRVCARAHFAIALISNGFLDSVNPIETDANALSRAGGRA
jgi:hypothetical protein